MIFGITIKKIETEIQHIFLNKMDVTGVYGFGSFFRKEPFNDIDILIVTSAKIEELISTYDFCDSKLSFLGRLMNYKFHMLMLTKEEYNSKPLLESDHLTILFEREVDN